MMIRVTAFDKRNETILSHPYAEDIHLSTGIRECCPMRATYHTREYSIC